MELKTVKDLVESVLKDNIETRANDTLLYMECVKKLGAKTLEDVEEINLSIISVHKMRQIIQNKHNMYLPEKEVVKNRLSSAKEIRELIKNL